MNFEVGMKIDFTGDLSATRAGGPLSVTAINRSAGSMTVGANLNTITGLTSNDYIFVQGDLNGKVSGLEAWLPSSVTSTSFFGVDRTADSTRLGGCRYDGSAQPIEEAMIDGLSFVEREGGAPTHGFMNFANLSNLKKALGSKVQYVDLQGPAKLSFKGVLIDGNKAPVAVVGDQNCPSLVSYLVQMDVCKLYSLGMAPRILDADGLNMLRERSADAVELRLGLS